MGDARSRDLVTHARKLEQDDLDVAARLVAATGLLQRVDTVRERACRVRTGLQAIPDEIAQAEQAERDARAREADAQRGVVEAEQKLEAVSRSRRLGEDAKTAAERALRRATVAAADAGVGVVTARGRLEALVIEEATLQAEGEGLAVEARQVASEVAEVPRISDSGRSVPGVTLEEIEEWGGRTHAALFLVRGGLEDERERLVVEANGLAASVLDEHVGGSSVALVRRRLEETLGAD